MRNIIETLESEALKTGIPDFVPGDTVVVQVTGQGRQLVSVCRPMKVW